MRGKVGVGVMKEWEIKLKRMEKEHDRMEKKAMRLDSQIEKLDRAILDFIIKHDLDRLMPDAKQ